MPKIPFVSSLPRPRLPQVLAGRVRVPGLRLVTVVVALVAVAVVGQASYSSSPGGYVVQPGDSLWAISQRSGVSVQSLA
ncbi:MAG: LysM peptidoglycan-binding domain-containing protein, partial [Actinomycetes bacterium]